MDKILIPASITLESSNLNKKYRWKSDLKKESIYSVQCKRAILRFTCKSFAYKLSKLNKLDRRVSLSFTDLNHLLIKREKNGHVSLQGHTGNHPVVQVSANKALPDEWRKKYGDKTKTLPINIIFNLDEWEDLNISPADFLIEVEKDPKSLMRRAIGYGFLVERVSRGRMYDLQLISPSKKDIIIAMSSHIARNDNRSREKRIQKILMDISKMLVYIYENSKAIPVIVSQPIESDKSWSYTTKNYVNFYKDKFGFKFITTDFKKGWEDNVIKELLKL